eukprot:TRINITY_DN27614_c0_g1_i1.p1 TRINITY_DN27614_c0_g1~~TRINITY_DN27614_c0_g1_i1.p1  ORF type:complete len:2694 (+),score=299.82 TRINITY_DN27614_c0_g1_i1:41-8083(+)
MIDRDLDGLEFGGLIQWEPPPDLTLVTGYYAYLSDAPDGGGRSLVDDSYTTHNEGHALGETVARTPKSAPCEPATLELCSSRLDVGFVPVGTNEIDLAPDQPKDNKEWVVVYVATSLTEQTTPYLPLRLSDSSSTVLDVNFTDYDLDVGDLGGTVTWEPSNDADQITEYYVYFGPQPNGSGRSFLGVPQVNGSLFPYLQSQGLSAEEAGVRALRFDEYSIVLPVNQPNPYWFTCDQDCFYLATYNITPLPLDYVLVYAASTLHEQTTPYALKISDTDSSATNVNFTDRDLDEYDLGGTITWEEPADISLVTHYLIYLSMASYGKNRSQVGSEMHYTVPLTLELLPNQPFYHPDIEERLGLEEHRGELLEDAWNWVVVYSRSQLVEQTTPAYVNIYDVRATVSNGYLEEEDLDALDIGGPITWDVLHLTPADLAQITHYDVYFAISEDARGENRSQLGDPLPVGTNIIHVPVNFLQDNYTHMQIYTRSSLLEQTTPHVFIINNTDSSVTAIVFPDDDMDNDELGGNVTWMRPEDHRLVTFYVVYLSEDPSGNIKRSQIGPEITLQQSREPYVHHDDGRVTSGDEVAELDPEQPEENFTQIVVYTRSVLQEQTTPEFLNVSDTYSVVQDASFFDKDLDFGDLGGAIFWTAPEDNVRTQHYVVYLAETAAGGNRSIVSDAYALAYDRPKGVNVLHVKSETLRASWEFVVIYTRSRLVEQTTPVPVKVSDTIASVSNIEFLDLDLDFLDLGGTIYWNPPDPANEAQVTFYEVYFAEKDPAGAYLHTLHANGSADWTLTPNGTVPVGTNYLVLEDDYTRIEDQHIWILVYTRSSLVEQTYPVGNIINDSLATARNLSFIDRDLDDFELGGTVYWDAPPAEENVELVAIYDVYLAGDGIGNQRSQIATGMAPHMVLIHENDSYLELGERRVDVKGAFDIFLLPHTALRHFTHVVVYTRSSFTEQTTPLHFEFSDTGRYVTNLTFFDLDLDQYNVGGNVSWQEPYDNSLVTHYIVYLAETSAGDVRSQVDADLVVGTEDVFVPADSYAENKTHVVVYTRSTLVEQSTPVPVFISDTIASVSGLSFVDQDLDRLELTGEIHWIEPPYDWRVRPADETSIRLKVNYRRFVAFYDVYMANGTMGEQRSRIGDPVPVDTSFTSFDPEHPIGIYTYLLVYTRSILTEQTTPFYLWISDTTADVTNLTFSDRDLDSDDLGGHVYWDRPLDWYQVTSYFIYIAESANGSQRSQIGEEIQFNQSFAGRYCCDYAPTGCGKLPGSTNSKGCSEFVALLEPDFSTSSYTHIVAYSQSLLAQQTTPVAFEIVDRESVVVVENRWPISSFTDRDLDGDELGGTIYWDPAGDVNLVTAYDVYFAIGPAGENRSQLNVTLPAPTYELDVAVNYNHLPYTYILIYTRSSLVEQTTPAPINISDANWNVRDINFLDLDLDEMDMGGRIFWTFPEERVLVTHYVVYLSASPEGSYRSQVGPDLAEGTFYPTVSDTAWYVRQPEQAYADLAPEQVQGNHSHIVVYTKSSLTEQTTPTSLLINNTASSVSNIVFIDRDLDPEELGDNITWDTPEDPTWVTYYLVYLSATATAENRSQIQYDVLRDDANLVHVIPETKRRWFDFVNVYTRSRLVEQTTPDFLAISDTITILTDVEFVDKDLDVGDLGGNVTWTVVRDLAIVTHFVVYWASDDTWGYEGNYYTDPEGVSAIKKRAGADIPADEAYDDNNADLFIPSDTEPPLETYPWVSVFSSSVLIESTTPFSAPINDTVSPVINITFVDLDLDLEDLGGNISWTHPLEMAQVTHYDIYLAVNETGAGRSRVGTDVDYATDITLLEPETPEFWMGMRREYVVVYSRSILVEMTTPTFTSISDVFSVSEVNFTDLDLDATQIGDKVFWETPGPDFEPVLNQIGEEVRLVWNIIVYLATDSAGSNYSQVGPIHDWKQREQFIPPEHYFAPYTHVVVYTKSALVEQTTPAYRLIVDSFASVTNLSFQDKDLDETQLGGDIYWVAPETTGSENVLFYAVYIRPGPSGQRSQVEGTGVSPYHDFGVQGVTGLVPVGTETEFILQNYPQNTFDEIAVYTRSLLVEQTTPVTIPLLDEIATISNLFFFDEDRDLDELGGTFTWDLPNDTSEVTFYFGYFVETPGWFYTNRRFEFQLSTYVDRYNLPMHTPQGGSGSHGYTEAFNFFSVFTRSSLCEQTTPHTLEIVDFCQNVPILENSTFHRDQGIRIIEESHVSILVLENLIKLTEDGMILRFVPLRKGPLWMMISTRDHGVSLTNWDVKNLIQAKGGASCNLPGGVVISCTNMTNVFSDCGPLPIGSLHLYRFHAVLLGYETHYPYTAELEEYAWFDFFINSVYFNQDPKVHFRNRSALGVRFEPSHDGYVWFYVVPMSWKGDPNYADQVMTGDDPEFWIRTVKSMYLADTVARPYGMEFSNPQMCQVRRERISGRISRQLFLWGCDFELGHSYRIFILVEDGDERHDGTLKTIDFAYQGEMTLATAIHYSHVVPSSNLWRVVPFSPVTTEWRVHHVKFYSDVTCTHLVATYPSPYNDRLLTMARQDVPLPNGAAFSNPGPLPASTELVDESNPNSDYVGWTSGQPCEVDSCHIGFAFGNSQDGPERTNVAVQVGCAEVKQSDVAGEFSETLELQYYREGTGYVGYRSVFDLTGGTAYLPTFNGTLHVHTES